MCSSTEAFLDIVAARRTVNAGIVWRYRNSDFAEYFTKILQPASKLIPRCIINTLYYADDLDVIVCMEIEDTKLKLFDLVGTRIPTLDAILVRIPNHIKEVMIYFTPERLDVNTQAIPHVLDGAMLMVRGAFAAEGKEFMLPRSARC